MGFFKSLKGDHPDAVGETNDTPSSMSQGQRPFPSRRNNQEEEFSPPPGPPPGRTAPHQTQDYEPPPFPPPSHHSPSQTANNNFEPPLFPSPSHQSQPLQQAPTENPPPYHDWTVIPDTALLPPPPSIGFKFSPTGNTSRDEGDRAQQWCLHNPLWTPTQPSDQIYKSVRDGDIRLVKPREYTGHLTMPGRGRWRGSTKAGAKDSILLTGLPLYFAKSDSPLMTEVPKTIYFEVRINSLGRGRGTDEASIALGFAAQPYPPWRMPGWERGSLGVHSDDGRRYVNDPWGGNDFTTPFKEGETIGLGMTFSVPTKPPQYGQPGAAHDVEVFMTRNGRKEGTWDLHEEVDNEKEGGGVDGLEGHRDLYGAIGVFGGAEFEACFERGAWQYQPQ